MSFSRLFSGSAIESMLNFQLRKSSMSHYDKTHTGTGVNKFSFKGVIKNPAVMPLVVIIGSAMVGVSSFIVYSCRTRESVSFNRSNPTIAESMNIMDPEPKKILVFNQQYRPMVDLDAAMKYKDVESSQDK